MKVPPATTAAVITLAAIAVAAVTHKAVDVHLRPTG
jgi:hypothetical protein